MLVLCKKKMLIFLLNKTTDIRKCHTISVIIHLLFTNTEFTECLYEVVSVVTYSASDFVLNLVLCMTFVYLCYKCIVGLLTFVEGGCMPKLQNVSLARPCQSNDVTPKNLRFCADQMSAVAQTLSTSLSLEITDSFRIANSQSIRCIRVFRHISLLPPLRPSTSFWNDGCSSTEEHCTVSTTKSNTSLFTHSCDMLARQNPCLLQRGLRSHCDGSAWQFIFLFIRLT